MARPVHVAVVGVLALAACAHSSGGYIWVDSYTAPPRAPHHEYVIGVGDQISVRVYNQDGMSARQRVRADGKISLPFLNDVPAAGMTTVALAAEIQKGLKAFVVNPVVTVSLEEARPFEVFVVGEVTRPGRYVLEGGGSVLQAIAAAGGLSPFAVRDRIFVVRPDPTPVRIRFRYDALTRLEGRAAAFALKNGDSIVVE